MSDEGDSEPIDTKRCTIHIDCKNKRLQPDGFAAEWPVNVSSLAQGTGVYDGQKWLNEALEDIADDVEVCTEHCRFRAKIKDEHDGKWEKPITLNSKAYKFVDPLKDRIFVKLKDISSCNRDIGSCKIGDYSSFKAKKRIIGKKRKAPKTKKTKKRRRLNDDESNEEEHDDDEYSEDDDIEHLAKYDGYSTDSDEDDPNKSKKKARKTKEPPTNARLWTNFVEVMTVRFRGEISMPGIVALCRRYFRTKHFPEKIPKDIEKKYGIKRRTYSRSINHDNYQHVATSPSTASHGDHISNNNMVPMHHSYSQSNYPQQNRTQTPYIHHDHHMRTRSNFNARYQYQHYPEYQHQNTDFSIPPPVQHQHFNAMPSPTNSDQESNGNTNTNNAQ